MRRFRLKYYRINRGIFRNIPSGFIFTSAGDEDEAKEKIEEYLRLNRTRVHDSILKVFSKYKSGGVLPPNWDFLETDRLGDPI